MIQQKAADSSWTRQRLNAFLITILALVALTGLFGRTTVANALGTFAPQPVIASIAQGTPDGSEPRLFVVSVYPYGFESDEISVPAGPCSLMIRDLTGIEDSLLFSVSVPGYPAPITYQLEHLQESVENVTLLPGTYVVTEATHPTWRCQVTVTP